MSDATSQAIDNLSGTKEGFSIANSLEHGAFSAGSNLFASIVVKYANAIVNARIKANIQKAESVSFREEIKSEVTKDYSTWSRKQINVEVAKRIAGRKQMYKEQGEQIKVAIKTGLDRTSDYLQSKQN